jgi:ferrous iron transport protein A
MFMTLDKTPRGSTVRIISLDSSDVVTLRLMEMGMVPGSAVRVVKSAPLGDPIQICIGNQHLALRRNEARAITVSSD